MRKRMSPFFPCHYRCNRSNISGATAISPDYRTLAATNIRSGIDWYNIFTEPWHKTSTSYEVQHRSTNMVLPVKFANKGRVVVMGTTKGYAVIMDSKHGQRIQTLDHGGKRPFSAAPFNSLIFSRKIMCHSSGKFRHETSAGP